MVAGHLQEELEFSSKVSSTNIINGVIKIHKKAH